MTGNREPGVMLTRMSEDDWAIMLEVFDAAQSRRGEPGHDDRKFLEALHFFTVHNLHWRAIPAGHGKWNSVWKRFWRLSRSGVFEAMFQLLAERSGTAHLVQMLDSTVVRAHVSAAGANVWPAPPASSFFDPIWQSASTYPVSGLTLAKMEIRASRAS